MRRVDAGPPAGTGGAQAAIRAIWTRRREEIIGRVDGVDVAVAALLDGSLDEPTRENGHQAAHQLAGTAALEREPG